jgi:hypothetical protein
MTSTLSSLISLRVFLTASVVSDLSSRTEKWIFCPPIVGVPSISIVFFSGMPSDAAGPVADSVTPTLISAQATPQAAIAASPRARPDFFIVFLRCGRAALAAATRWYWEVCPGAGGHCSLSAMPVRGLPSRILASSGGRVNAMVRRRCRGGAEDLFLQRITDFA